MWNGKALLRRWCQHGKGLRAARLSCSACVSPTRRVRWALRRALDVPSLQMIRQRSRNSKPREFARELLIFTTTYNEGGNIGLLLDRLVEVAPDADILECWRQLSRRGHLRGRREEEAGLSAARQLAPPEQARHGSAHKYALFYAMREELRPAHHAGRRSFPRPALHSRPARAVRSRYLRDRLALLRGRHVEP